jgi:transposase
MIISHQKIVELRIRHRTERDGRVKDRIKAIVLYFDEKMTVPEIARALLIKETTVDQHIKDYIEEEKLKPENGGSSSKLTEDQTTDLIKYFEENTHTDVKSMILYVKEKYKIDYTISGFTNWLSRNGFSYKQPKGVPSKADPAKQEEFMRQYAELKKLTPENEPILFGDGVHPTMATKISYGWIRTGQDKEIKTTGSRTRVNLFGSINLKTMDITTTSHKTIDSGSMDEHFGKLKEKYKDARMIHMILDQGPYNKSAETKLSAEKHGIILHYLPTYSPNLNPIERLWKVMNEHVRNNVFFESAKECKAAIDDFFDNTWPEIKQSMVNRVNDNFQVLTTS